LSAAAVWLKSIDAPQPEVVTILLNDQGRKASAGLASGRVNRGEGVIAADLLFTGDSVPRPNSTAFVQLLATTGDRPLGLEAAQLIALTTEVRAMRGARSFRLETTGFRSQNSTWTVWRSSPPPQPSGSDRLAGPLQTEIQL
jgi:hypothetical protein